MRIRPEERTLLADSTDQGDMATGAATRARDGLTPAAVDGTRLPVTVAGAAVLAFAASYAASLLGHAMVLPGEPVGLLWPPNAIILAALLSSPARAWPAYLFGALAATLVAAVQHDQLGWSSVGVPGPGMVQCLLVAVAMRRLLGGPPCLDRLRDVTLYLAAAGLAPLAVVSVGALLVAGVGAGFLAIWSPWLLGEVLTHATFTALFLAWLGRGPVPADGWTVARGLELGAVAVAGALGSLFVLHGSGEPGRSPVTLLALVPLLLWGAVRFAVRGATTVVTAVTVVALLGAARGQEPLASVAAAVHVQLILLVIAIPLLVLPAVLAARRDADGGRRDPDGRPMLTEAASFVGGGHAGGDGRWPTTPPSRDAVPPRTADATRSAQRLLQSTMDALSAHIAILDERGRVIAINEPWRRCAEHIGLPHPGPGVDYAALCDGVQGPMAREARRIASAIREMLQGGRAELRLDYRSETAGQPQWFQLRMARFSDDESVRLVLAHENISGLKQAEAALRDLTGRLLRLQDEERRRIARELHDGAGQNLVALSMNLARLARLVRADDRTGGIVADSLMLVEQSLQEMRTLSYVLHPPTLDGVGLGSAVRWYVDGFAKRSGIAVRLDLPLDAGRLPQEVESALFRVIQESLINIHRHSGSGTAAIRLRRGRGLVRLDVSDDGAGFATALPGDGQGSFGGGIPGMRERLRQLGGHLDIRSDARGTTVTAVAPLEAESDAQDLAR